MAQGVCKTLIDDILSYSQTAFGDHTKEEVDMNVILENVISNLNEVIEETGTTIGLPMMPVISGIPHQLNQLFDTCSTTLLSTDIRIVNQ
ncbi:MAG: hypothetical protein WDM78_02890 [Puia sp.]